MAEITIHSDGAARGNPGPAGAGATLTSADGKVVAEVCRYLGEMTNNQAEYHALLLALEEAKRLGATGLRVFVDSELVARQLKGEYRVKNKALRPVFQDVLRLLRSVGAYTIEYMPRSKNRRADQLANLAIDGQVL